MGVVGMGGRGLLDAVAAGAVQGEEADGLGTAGEIVAFALELARSAEPSRTASLVADALVRTAGIAFAAVYLVGPEGTLALEAAAGDLPAALEPPPPVVERALGRGRTTLADETEISAVFPQVDQPSLVATAPISVHDDSFGVLLVGGSGRAVDAGVRLVSAVADLAASSLANVERLRASAAEARRDALTELLNQRAFHEHLDRALGEARADAGEVSLVLFDLDDFKQINDREGHVVGDRVLQEVARRTRATLRLGEEAFRLGGEEFAIVVAGDVEAGKRVAERLRKALAGRRRREGLPSISAGVASFPADGEGKEALLHKADLALYAAKERGKDQVVAYHERLAAETAGAHDTAHRAREEEWWLKVLGVATTRIPLADELGPGCRPQEVALLAERVGGALGLSRDELGSLVLAAYLTELSKLRLPETIRRKRGPLNERDWSVVRESAELAADSLAPLDTLRDVREIVHGCRERWDGTGYPSGLAGAEIAVGARVVAVCEAYCAMTSGRSYRPARTRARALLELQEHAGTHFDPDCVRALLEVLALGSAGSGSGAESSALLAAR